MNKLLTTLLIISCLNLTAQFNAELKTSISPYGLNNELLLGYNTKYVNPSILLNIKYIGINNQFFVTRNNNKDIFINHKVYFNNLTQKLTIDLPQLGLQNTINDNLKLNFVVGPDIVNFVTFSFGTNFYF